MRNNLSTFALSELNKYLITTEKRIPLDQILFTGEALHVFIFKKHVPMPRWTIGMNDMNVSVAF